MLQIIIGVLILTIGLASCRPEDGRVVNGTNAEEGKYSFMVSLQKWGNHFCGGSIIRPTIVLTAAHCLDGEKPEDVFVRYQCTDLRSRPIYRREAEKLIIHENYDRHNNFVNDIGLVKTTDPFYNVVPIMLPKPSFELPVNNSKGTLLGWGYNATGGILPPILQKAKVTAYSHAVCKAMFGRVFPTQLCSGVDNGGKGQCHGDSGGPLIFNDGVNNMVIAIVSYGTKNCTLPPFPYGVMSRIAPYDGWISNKIDKI